MNKIVRAFKDNQSSLGMSFDGEPEYIEIPDRRELKNEGLSDKDLRNGGDFIYCIEQDISPEKAKSFMIAVVLISRDSDKPPIKRKLDSLGVISQFLLEKNISKKVSVRGVVTNLLRQMNAKCYKDLYRMDLTPKFSKTMTVGVDVVNQGRKSIIGLSASYSKYMTQHFTKVEYQELHKEMIGKEWTKERQEIEVTKARQNILAKFIESALENYTQKNQGQRPDQIVIFRDGVGGPTYQTKCLEYELP